MSFTNFTTRTVIGFGGEYLELIPHERLRYTDVFDDPKLPGEILVTVTLKNVSVGTHWGVRILEDAMGKTSPAQRTLQVAMEGPRAPVLCLGDPIGDAQ